MKKILAVLMTAAVIFSGTACENSNDQKAEFHDAESTQSFVEGMGVGWNLGNTLDPVDCTWVSTDLDYETAWGNPKTTRELIQYIKSEGFDTIRVPVTWTNHVGSEPDYVIKTEWLDRV